MSALLVVSAVVLGPVALVKAGATTLMLAPAAVAEVSAQRSTALSRQTQQAAEQFQRRMQEAQGDPAKQHELALQGEQQIKELSRSWATTGGVLVGSTLAIVLGFLAVMLGVALLYGIGIPLATATLAVLVADRVTGGNLGPGAAFGAMARRLGMLLSAQIPAFLLVLVGLCVLVLPGLVLGFLFFLVTPVVLFENVGGIAALRRSSQLVKAHAGKVLLVALVFAAMRIFVQITAGLVVPARAAFVGSLLQDALLIFLLPIPIIGTLLLYLDIRRQSEGFDDWRLKAQLDAIRAR